jgi:hypothetical protein
MASPEEQRREARERTRELEVAFVTVFGDPHEPRSKHQQLVWDWLALTCFHTRPGLQRLRDNGAVDPIATAIAAANHDVFLGIEALVRKGALPVNPITHPQPTAVRE